MLFCHHNIKVIAFARAPFSFRAFPPLERSLRSWKRLEGQILGDSRDDKGRWEGGRYVCLKVFPSPSPMRTWIDLPTHFPKRLSKKRAVTNSRVAITRRGPKEKAFRAIWSATPFLRRLHSAGTSRSRCNWWCWRWTSGWSNEIWDAGPKYKNRRGFRMTRSTAVTRWIGSDNTIWRDKGLEQLT